MGAKLRGPRGALTGIVLVPTVTLPIGDGPFAARKTVFSTGLHASLALGPSWGLGAYAALALNPGSGSDYLISSTPAAALSRSLTRRLSFYVEGGYRPAEQSENPAYARGGFTVLVSPTAQLDVNADREVTATDGADWLFGGGAFIRFGG